MTPTPTSSFRRCLAGLTCALLLVAPSTAGAQERWQVGWMPTLSSGTYGGDERTDVLYTPLTARRLFDSGDVALVVPWLCVWGGGGLVVVNATPVVPDQSATRTRAAAAAVAPARPAASTGTRLQPSRTCGLGDVVVRGRYYVSDQIGRRPSLALRAHLKVPTADAGRGLGTGRPDEGLALELGQPLARGVTLLADAGYTWVGRPVGADYRDTWWYDVGISRDIARGAVNLAVLYEEYGAVRPGDVNARDVLAAATIRGAAGWRVQAAGTVGLSAGAPDHGLTVGLSRRF